jgi:hypothetical protein
VRDGRKVIFFLPGLVVAGGAAVELKSFASLAGTAGSLPALAARSTSAADTAATRVPTASNACEQLKAQLTALGGEVAALRKRIAAGGSGKARWVRGRNRLQSERARVTSLQGSLCGAGGTAPGQKQPVTIGPDLGRAPDTKRHTTVDTVDIPLAPSSSSGGGGAVTPYAFPVAGNVTEFKVRGFADGGGAGISFLIIHPEGGGRYTAKQYAGNFTLPGTDGVSSFKPTYGVPVAPGDTFAIYNSGGVDWHVFASAPSAGMLDHSQTTLNQGDSFSPDLVPGTQVLIDATEAPG